MSDLVSIELAVNALRSALASGQEEEIDRCILSVESRLLETEVYKEVFNERLLAEAFLLLDECYGDEIKTRLNGITEHLNVVRTYHDKLFAILDSKIELEVLLFDSLDGGWPDLDRRIGCSFDDTLKRQLQACRQLKNSSEILGRFLEVYLSALERQGLDDVLAIIRPPLMASLRAYERANQWTAHGLFTFRDQGEVLGIQIRSEAANPGRARALTNVSDELENAANEALTCASRIWSAVGQWGFVWSLERKDIRFGGDSLGLGLTMGIAAAALGFDIDAYTAFTGQVEWASGSVRRIGELEQKLKAAKAVGIRRVIIPQENTAEIPPTSGLEVVGVTSVEDAWEHLQRQATLTPATPLERLAQVRIRETEIELGEEGIQKVRHELRQPGCIRVVFSDHRDETPVDIYFSKRLALTYGGKDTPLKRSVIAVFDRVFGAKPEVAPKAQEFDRFLIRDPIEKQNVEQYVFNRGDAIRETEQNCSYRAKIVKAFQVVYVRQFENGTLTIQGSGPLYEDIRGRIRALLGAAYRAAASGQDEKLAAQLQAVAEVDLGDQWIGTDEAGKGDYFGPLVSAAVMVDKTTAAELEKAGVKDSKSLSDKRNRELAVVIQQICGKKANTVVIPPERYNALYDQFRAEGKNLNTLLAWAHTRALEDILTRFPQERISVLIDKFADEHYIEEKLLAQGRKTHLNLIQLPKAEANIAVAAASVLARTQFLQWLERLSKQYGMILPKGASDPRIPELGRQIVARGGKSELAKLAKLHFKTTEQILPNSEK